MEELHYLARMVRDYIWAFHFYDIAMDYESQDALLVLIYDELKSGRESTFDFLLNEFMETDYDKEKKAILPILAYMSALDKLEERTDENE